VTRRHQPLPVTVERHIVGFYLHERSYNLERRRYDGCGQVAFWCTAHPTGATRLSSDADRTMNGQVDLLARAYSTEGNYRHVQCVSCGAWTTLHLKRYRAIPRPDDVLRPPRVGPVRAMDLLTE
jgi:hypothetical protein